jgi:hypothetical protein
VRVELRVEMLPKLLKMDSLSIKQDGQERCWNFMSVADDAVCASNNFSEQ